MRAPPTSLRTTKRLPKRIWGKTKYSDSAARRSLKITDKSAVSANAETALHFPGNTLNLDAVDRSSDDIEAQKIIKIGRICRPYLGVFFGVAVLSVNEIKLFALKL